MTGIGIIGIRMMTVEELHNMKTTPIDVKMDISSLEIRSDGFPDCHLRMQTLHCTPCGVADSFAVNAGRYKKQVKVPVLSIDLNDQTAD